MEKLSIYLSLLKYSLSNPKQGIKLLKEYKDSNSDSHQNLNKYDIQPKTSNEIFNFLFNNSFPSKSTPLKNLEEHLKSFFEKIKSIEYPSKKKPYPINYSIIGESGPFLYEFCKQIKPELIVETGVAYGVSTSYILQALHENKKGKLISIDSIFRPWQSKEMIGSAIPDSLKDKWKLYLGGSDKQLNEIFKNFSDIDIFLHDSLHTYKNMMFEFKKSWLNIKTGGYLLSDDILGNNAFYDFCKMTNKTPLLLFQKIEPISLMGIIVK